MLGKLSINANVTEPEELNHVYDLATRAIDDKLVSDAPSRNALTKLSNSLAKIMDELSTVAGANKTVIADEGEMAESVVGDKTAISAGSSNAHGDLVVRSRPKKEEDDGDEIEKTRVSQSGSDEASRVPDKDESADGKAYEEPDRPSEKPISIPTVKKSTRLPRPDTSSTRRKSQPVASPVKTKQGRQEAENDSLLDDLLADESTNQVGTVADSELVTGDNDIDMDVEMEDTVNEASSIQHSAPSSRQGLSSRQQEMQHPTLNGRAVPSHSNGVNETLPVYEDDDEEL